MPTYIEKQSELLSSCSLCPRLCGVDRSSGEKGFCGAGSSARIARAMPHLWEEPCICSEKGSGTVFFSNCNLGCVYCQNNAISHEGVGEDVSIERLSEIYLELEEKGVCNINFVTPTHFVPQIMLSLDLARERGLGLPTVYNTSGYERPETIKMLNGYVNVYLPDFKYLDCEVASKYSGARDYPEFAKASLREMVKQSGRPAFDDDGMMWRGVVVRHLVLPGMAEMSRRVIEYLYREYGNDIYISIMSQYTPPANVCFPELSRRVTRDEYMSVVDFASRLGVESGFVQDGEAASESFVPSFALEGVKACDCGKK